MSDYGKYVNRLPPGTDPALARALADIFRDLVNDIKPQESKLKLLVTVKDFGAKGDGTTDDTASIQAAINYCAANGITRLYVPAGEYRVSTQFIINDPIMLIGDGAGYIAHADFSATIGTKFSWYGGSTAVIAFENVNYGGFGIEGIYIDARDTATSALVVSDCVGGRFTDVTVRNYATRGIWLRSTLTYSNNTNSWHKFTNITLESVVSGASEAIRCGGVTSGGNACHITFDTVRITHGGTAHGIVLGGCDNITFIMTFIYRDPTGTPSGYGVTIDASEVTNFPMSNYFYHLQAGQGGYYQATWPGGTYQTSHIYGYALDNGQPAVSAPTGSVTVFDGGQGHRGLRSIGPSNGNNSSFTYNFSSGAAVRTVSFATAEPDANYRIILVPKQQVTLAYWPSNFTSSGFDINFPSDPGGTVTFDVIVIRA